MQVIIHLFKPIEYTIPRLKSKVNYGLCVSVGLFLVNMYLSGEWCGNEGGYVCVGAGTIWEITVSYFKVFAKSEKEFSILNFLRIKKIT